MNRAWVIPLAAVAACHFGPRTDTFPPAVMPDGAQVHVKARDTSFVAELLAVSDSGLLLLRKPTVVFAPYLSMRQVTFPDLSASQELRRDERPDSAAQEQLRLVSRFPQGVSRDRLRSLLAAYRQDSVVVLQR